MYCSQKTIWTTGCKLFLIRGGDHVSVRGTESRSRERCSMGEKSSVFLLLLDRRLRSQKQYRSPLTALTRSFPGAGFFLRFCQKTCQTQVTERFGHDLSDVKCEDLLHRCRERWNTGVTSYSCPTPVKQVSDRSWGKVCTINTGVTSLQQRCVDRC